EDTAQDRRFRVEAVLAQALLGVFQALPGIQAAAEPVHLVRRQAQAAGGIAQGAAAAVADHGGGQGGAFAAVLVVDVLDDLLAPLVLEVHVDVGRFVALAREEAAEQQARMRRIHRGDAQGEADRRIRRRTPAL